MKISELIDKLNKLLEEHGDHDVHIADVEMDDLEILPPVDAYPFTLII